MKLSLPLLGGLILVVSACGGEKVERSGHHVSLVRELHVESDYGQIYIDDPETQAGEWDELRDEDETPIFRAMDDASDSRRFVGYDSVWGAKTQTVILECAGLQAKPNFRHP